jgi:molybdopterin-guanine dinucleotide biosynthesis protein B
MKVAGFAGYSGSGKTSLIEQLIPALRLRGLRVSVVKHAHHRFEIDQPGKDTWRHRQAGAVEVVAVSSQRLVLMREFETPGDVKVHQALAALQTRVDWVLVEGFKHANLAKLEVWRQATGKPACYPDDPFVAGIITDSPEQLPEATARPVLDLNQPDAVAQWLVDNGDRFEYDPATHA